MKTKIVLVLSIITFLFSCQKNEKPQIDLKLRPVADTVGFATKGWQVDSLINRMDFTFGENINEAENWKTVISPHDDYTYVNDLYLKTLNNLNANTIIVFGVAHRARNFELQDKLIFDSFEYWKGAYSKIKVSAVREEITKRLPTDMFVVHNEMQMVEHSVEALLPFLQSKNQNIEIISILVPYMKFERMNKVSEKLSGVIAEIAKNKKWKWGSDFAFAISSDAVHYGDEDWGGKNYALFGADNKGYEMATEYEMEIIEECLVGEITEHKIEAFTKHTVKEENYKEYKWTWCGRYSIPFGLLTTKYTADNLNENLAGEFIGYSTSIDKERIPVEDLGMGRTASATIRHWVGYASIGYK
jgi:AmmeMemoRadiSam system protein B